VVIDPIIYNNTTTASKYPNHNDTTTASKYPNVGVYQYVLTGKIPWYGYCFQNPYDVDSSYDDNVWGYFIRTTEPKTEEFKLSHKEEMRQQRNFDPRKFKGK